MRVLELIFGRGGVEHPPVPNRVNKAIMNHDLMFKFMYMYNINNLSLDKSMVCKKKLQLYTHLTHC